MGREISGDFGQLPREKLPREKLPRELQFFWPVAPGTRVRRVAEGIMFVQECFLLRPESLRGVRVGLHLRNGSAPRFKPSFFERKWGAGLEPPPPGHPDFVRTVGIN